MFRVCLFGHRFVVTDIAARTAVRGALVGFRPAQHD